MDGLWPHRYFFDLLNDFDPIDSRGVFSRFDSLIVVMPEPLARIIFHNAVGVSFI